MRYIFYILTLGLVFTCGMLVGNLYIPSHNSSLAAAVSVPDLDRSNPAINEADLQQAQANLQSLTQALTACPAVVEEEKQRLFNQISLFLALQDFKSKRYIYAAEIAKNMQETQTTPQFTRAAQDYADAKSATEQLADTLFPLPPAEEPQSQPNDNPSAQAAENKLSTATAVSAGAPDPQNNTNK